ncbi:hypothetical protein OG2516_14026 [Oceanicola granulosus HTCC2516]|uniref:Uncharacterized protein n=1 Tax=Oceanicola granulosus (strain ATCC BAA-861 / DSM 15982 / KCTC 12143 / HTCC2516) TaxID=314256 RepID=Q2CAU9_OCEGH|nr:hypothetical protein [Oceanicola granulosus]EAR49782.1 hypothetical protein OG2516_14026 [Oceanicola granulosus HTCC2516]
MTNKTPLIDRIRREAEQTSVAMPWQRGARRAAFIARRKDAELASAPAPTAPPRRAGGGNVRVLHPV